MIIVEKIARWRWKISVSRSPFESVPRTRVRAGPRYREGRAQAPASRSAVLHDAVDIVFPFGGIFRHGDTSINICAAGSGDHVTLDLPRPYANTRLHTRRRIARVRASASCTFRAVRHIFIDMPTYSNAAAIIISLNHAGSSRERSRSSRNS